MDCVRRKLGIKFVWQFQIIYVCSIFIFAMSHRAGWHLTYMLAVSVSLFFYVEYRIFSTDRGQWFCIRLLREGEVQRSYQKSIIQSRVGPGNQQFILSAEKIVHSRARCITILGGKYTYGDTRGALDKRDNGNPSFAVEFNELGLFRKCNTRNYIMCNFTAVEVFGKICGFLFVHKIESVLPFNNIN